MDVICFSHLRWDFVYQRPQHIMSRLAKQFRVFYIEEAIYVSDRNYLHSRQSTEGVFVITPYLLADQDNKQNKTIMQSMLSESFDFLAITQYIFWYYTPMALPIGNAFTPQLIVYDCMDELSAFKNAPQELKEKEKELMTKADIVFTGGYSLYNAKKDLHQCIYPFPSSIDKEHFGQARENLPAPADQRMIPHPRIGFFGVIDERMDVALLDYLAKNKPEWNFIIIGPVVKIEIASLPEHPNIFYLGSKKYSDLPAYLAGWDVAMMPFAINESTRYISPTKTPEYLAGGKPVVSTAIQDVIEPYGENGLVFIANNQAEFVEGLNSELNMINKNRWQNAVDAFLAQNSWDNSVEKMMFLINTKLEDKQRNKKKNTEAYV